MVLAIGIVSVLVFFALGRWQSPDEPHELTSFSEVCYLSIIWSFDENPLSSHSHTGIQSSQI